MCWKISTSDTNLLNELPALEAVLDMANIVWVHFVDTDTEYK